MRYATVGLLLTCLLACLLAFAALTALRDAPAYGAERVRSAHAVPGHTCSTFRGLPYVHNGPFQGLFQIWWAHAPQYNLFRGPVNVSVAGQMYVRLGFGPWM